MVNGGILPIPYYLSGFSRIQENMENNFPVMENTWKMRKEAKCPGKSCVVLENIITTFFCFPIRAPKTDDVVI